MFRPPTPTCVCAGLVVSGLAVAGCTRAPPSETAEAPAPARAPVTQVERYFPAPDGSVYAYDTLASHTGETGILMLQVTRPRPGRVDLTSGGKVERLVIGPEGIAYLQGGYLLRLPIAVGATFQGRAGPVRIVSVDDVVETPAGVFTDCISTLEEAHSETASRSVTSVLCPGVGLVSLTVEAITDEGHLEERAVLRSFGARVDLDAPMD